MVRALSARPAELLGLPSGRIAAGAPADLILVDLEQPWICEADKLHSRSKNTPFEGARFEGRVLMTLVGGRTVYKDNEA